MTAAIIQLPRKPLPPKALVTIHYRDGGSVEQEFKLVDFGTLYGFLESSEDWVNIDRVEIAFPDEVGQYA